MKKLFDFDQAKRFWGHIKDLFLPKPKNEGSFGKYLKFVSEDTTEWADFPAALVFKGVVDTFEQLPEKAERGDLYHITGGDQAGAEYFYTVKSWEYVGQLIKFDEDKYVQKVGDTMTGPLVISSAEVDAGQISLNNNSATFYREDKSAYFKINRDSISALNRDGVDIFNIILGKYSVATGYSSANGICSFASGHSSVAEGDYSHAEGQDSYANGDKSHAEGNNTRAEANNTHTEGDGTTATGDSAHAEGSNTKAQGVTSHAEGQSTTASGYYSHSEGISTTASGDGAHSEGNFTKASGENAHAEGLMTEAFGTAAHASGSGAKALGSASCAEGVGTIASQEAQHATGKYNASDNNALFIVGGGSSDSDRKNLFTVNTNGTATVATDPIKDMDVATKKYVDDVKDYAISLNGQAAKITKKNTIIDEHSNSIEFYSGYNSTLLEDFTAVNISQIAKGATTVTGTNWWGFSRPTSVGVTLYYPLIYFSSVSVKLIFNVTITKTTTNKSATYPVCMLADTPPTYTAVILSELPKGLDFVLSRKPDDPSSKYSDTSQLLSLKVDSSFLSECEVTIQLKQYSFVEGNKLGLKMITDIGQSDSPSYEKLVTDKNWVDYMEETTQLEKIVNHTSLIGTEIPWQSLEEAVAQSTANQADGATKGDITLNYNPNIFLNVDNITFEVGSGIPDTSYLYYTFKNFTNKLALS